jgi:hypothetical protein
MLAGGVYLAYLMKFQRQVLEHEPGVSELNAGPKGHVTRRSVPFPAVLSDELAALMVSDRRDDLVFADLRGGVLRNSNWRMRVFEPAVSKCQKCDNTFPSIAPHDLRNTAASLAVAAGANVNAIQRMHGHAKASMTLDVCADPFDDLDDEATNLDTAIRSSANPLRTEGYTNGVPANS